MIRTLLLLGSLLLGTGLAQSGLKVLQSYPVPASIKTEDLSMQVAFNKTGIPVLFDSAQVVTWNKQTPQVYPRQSVFALSITPQGELLAASQSYGPIGLMVHKWQGKKWVSVGPFLQTDVGTNNAFTISRTGQVYLVKNTGECAPGNCLDVQVFTLKSGTWKRIAFAAGAERRNDNYSVAVMDAKDALMVGAVTNERTIVDSQGLESGVPSQFGIFRYDGKNWKNTGTFPAEDASQVVLKQDPSGKVLLAYTLNGEVHVQRWNGTVWENLGKQSFPHQKPLAHLELALAADRQGNVAVAVKAQSQDQLSDNWATQSVLLRQHNGKWLSFPNTYRYFTVAQKDQRLLLVKQEDARLQLADLSSFKLAGEKAATEKPQPNNSLVTVFDPFMEWKAAKITPAEASQVKTLTLTAARKYWMTQFGGGTQKACTDESYFKVMDRTSGAFTRKGAKQTAYVYQYCNDGTPFPMAGLLVLEAQRMVLHVAFGMPAQTFRALPDVNGNGKQELLFKSGSIQQGYVVDDLSLMEFSDRKANELGNFQVFSNNCGTLGETYEESVQRLKVKPGKVPVFFQDTYQNQLPCQEQQNWKLSKTEQMVKPEPSFGNPPAVLFPVQR